MQVRTLLLACVFAGACYSAQPVSGAPCSPEGACPRGQVCVVAAGPGGICLAPGEGSGGDAPTTFDAADLDAPGSDSDAASGPTPSNDTPANAIDVSSAGTFPWTLVGATNDTSIPCVQSPGPDVFFELTLGAPEVIYLDTLGGGGNPALAVRRGACTDPAATMEACVDDSCGTSQLQGAWNLPAGEHCIVIEHAGGAGTASGMLKVVRGGRAGDKLPALSGTVTGDTCLDDDSNSAPCGCGPSRDHHYFFTTCGEAIARLSMCDSDNWDNVLQLRDATDANLGCNDDDMQQCQDHDAYLSRTIVGPGLFWGIVDGCASCGGYTLTYSISAQ